LVDGFIHEVMIKKKALESEGSAWILPT
jgi:hypothetical protein